MTSIYKYQKHITQTQTITLQFPEGEEGQEGTELATIEGTTYVSIPNGLELPKQPEELEVIEVSIHPELCEVIRKHSPHIRLIDERVVERIRKRYTQNDELKFARLGWRGDNSSDVQQELEAYDSFVEAARQWGREEKAKLGL